MSKFLSTVRYWITLDDRQRPTRLYTERIESGIPIVSITPESTDLQTNDAIPAGATEITPEQFNDITQHPGQLRWANGKLVPTERYEELLYKVAVADFLQRYAVVESCAFGLLQNYAGVSDEVARAIFSGTRLSAALGLVKRIAEFTGKSKAIQNELRAISEQLGQITATRDLLVHYGTEYGVVSNKRVAFERTLQERPVSWEILRQIRYDLDKASTHIQILYGALPSGPGTTSETVVGAPWRYKPSQPASRDQKPQRQRPSRKPQREPSNE